MNENQIVEHEAFVREIKDGIIIVDVLSKSACLSCQLKGVCSVSDIEEKSVEVAVDDTKKYEKGDKVNVYLTRNQGLAAVFLGYVLPFILVVLTLIIVLQLTNSQGIAGLSSIFILVPYYGLLYLFRKKISKKYKFKIKEN
jgi:sigma-E factor negative regulatory protein RseC